MVTVSRSQSFSMEMSQLNNNVKSDDTFHGIHSSVNISNSSFKDCYGDCIDLDYSKGKFNSVRISDARNDGLDFMESMAEVHDVLIVRAGDKAISAGELSKINISSSEFNDNNIGIAVKDKSNVDLSNVKFTENEIAVSIYAKNWRFGGPGHAALSMDFSRTTD